MKTDRAGLITTTPVILPLLIKHAFGHSLNIYLLSAHCTHQWRYRVLGLPELQNRGHLENVPSVIRTQLFKQKTLPSTQMQIVVGKEGELGER